MYQRVPVCAACTRVRHSRGCAVTSSRRGAAGEPGAGDTSSSPAQCARGSRWVNGEEEQGVKALCACALGPHVNEDQYRTALTWQ